jgi:hypothetical protein
MATTETAIWERILRPAGNEMSRRTAEEILQLTISEDDRANLRALLAKAKSGTITPSEESELDEYERCGNMLSILKSKARRVLKSKT